MSSVQLKRLLIFLGLLWYCCQVYGQDSKPVYMEIQKDETSEIPGIISTLVALENKSGLEFNGVIQVKTPAEFLPLSSSSISVLLAPNEKKFIPLKFQKQRAAMAGTTAIQVRLLSADNSILIERTLEEKVAPNDQMALLAETDFIPIQNPNDSISVKVRVTNMGNRKQPVTLVFKIPEMVGQLNFFEQYAEVKVQQDTVFTLRLLPAKLLQSGPKFTIEVSGLRGKTKEIFGHASITVQNTSSAQRFYNPAPHLNDLGFQQNSVTASYRSMGYGVDIYQFNGAADLDLTAGYLALQANGFTTAQRQQPVLNNTSITYHLQNNSLKIGNVAEYFEASLFGRGVQAVMANKVNDKRLEVGFVDQNFNLIEKNTFLKYGHGIYVKGSIGTPTSASNTTTTYMYKTEPFQERNNHIIGTEFQRNRGKWNWNTKLYMAESQYYTIQKDQWSFAAETQYNGMVNNWVLNGNYFYSSAYFPGNRTGLLQLQQRVQKTWNRTNMLFVTFNMNNFAPKSYSYPLNFVSNNQRIDLGFRFLLGNRVSGSLIGQQQSEKGNGFLNGITTTSEKNMFHLQAFRLVESVSWTSTDAKQSVNLTVENGLVRYPYEKQFQPQLKFSTNYRWNGLQLMASYQYGSYYLSEYTAVKRFRNESANKRLLLTASYEQQLIGKKLFLNGGGSYINDHMIGKTPSVFLNSRFNAGRRTQLFLNSSWYKYQGTTMSSLFAHNNGILNVEAGLTVKLFTGNASAGRKTNIEAQVYYDINNNNVFDKGDSLATDYRIMINDASFQTDAMGKLYYRKAPVGEYKIRPMTEKGWFASETTHKADRFKTKLQIPLHQNGSLTGSITYVFDKLKSKETNLRLEGIRFYIMKDGNIVQRGITNDKGDFIVFLEEGNYRVVIDENSLPADTYCTKGVMEIQVTSGKLVTMPRFEIEVKQKMIEVKQFTQLIDI